MFLGLALNGAGYLVYLILTQLFLEPKSAMSLLYVIGAIASFFGNKLYVFESTDKSLSSSLRFLVAHILGYGLNYFLLVVFVDLYGFAHQVVQAIAIFLVAIVLFILFRYFVFSVPKVEEVSR